MIRVYTADTAAASPASHRSIRRNCISVLTDAFGPHILAVTDAPITYLKLVTGGVRRHLCVADQASTDSITLCGCVVTRAQSWKQVKSLEGDECPHCADLAFGGGARRSESEST